MSRHPEPLPGVARLALQQVGYQIRLTLRSPTGPFFTFVIPLMVLVALNLVYGHHYIPGSSAIRFPRFYTPAMAAFAITNACYVNLLTGVTLSRQQGVLKRIRGTPLPSWVYLFGRAASASLLGLLSAASVFVVGTSMYPVSFPWHALPGLVFVAAAGVVCFCTLGLAASSAVRAADAALPVAYGTLLPLSFISDVFFPTSTSPAWLRLAASAFPLKPLARCLEAPFLSRATPINWADLGIMAAWTVAGMALLAIHFPWEPAAPDRFARLRRPLRRPPATSGS